MTEPYNAAMHLGHMASYREALRYSFGRRVLDIGCGVGYGAFFLASYGAKTVIGVDLDQFAIAYARQVYQRPNLQYLQATGLHLSFRSASFDFIFSSQVIEHVSSPEKFLQEISRLLAPNGFCMITTPNKKLFSPSGSTDNPHHLSEMSWDLFKKITSGVFPCTRFGGIPQRCLTSLEDQATPVVKHNSEIEPDNFCVQHHELEKCENMLCFGHSRVDGDFTISLPGEFQSIADEINPLFWDPAVSQWVVMGMYPPDLRLTSLRLFKQQTLMQVFESPYPYLYRVETDLLTVPRSEIQMSLYSWPVDGSNPLAQSISQPGNRRMELLFPPQPDSAGRQYVLRIRIAPGPLSLVHRVLPLRFRTWVSQDDQSHCAIDEKPQKAHLAIRTFHQSLPKQPVQNNIDSSP